MPAYSSIFRENADKIMRKIAESASGGALTPPQHLSRAIDGDGGQQRRDSGPHFVMLHNRFRAVGDVRTNFKSAAAVRAVNRRGKTKLLCE
jgi:hypothetical protein